MKGPLPAWWDGPLVAFIHELSPERSPPWHLARWCDLLERAPVGGVRGVCSVPVRHWKTWTTLHGIPWMLHRDPTLRIILMLGDHERATEIGKDVRRLCDQTPYGPETGFNLIHDWRNKQGGGVVVMSAEQSKLGRDCDVFIFDDPVTEKTADDPHVREMVDGAIAHYTARSGRGSRLGSVLGVMSRWDDDDPVGRRIRRTAVVNWEYVHHPAIQNEGTPQEHAFAPEVMSLDTLKQKREELEEQDPTERIWWAQFQGEPRRPGGELFKQPLRYVTLPSYGGFRNVYGIDMAYSTKKVSDYSAICVLRIWGSRAYVLEVERFKLDISMIEQRLRAAKERHGQGPVFSYVSGPEVGIVHEMANRGLHIHGLPARYNKLVRAEKTIVRWNGGDVMVPNDGPWIEPFVRRCMSFRGLETDDDDEVDAMVSACDGGMYSTVTSAPTRSLGAWRF
jgi:predicted phage terminase large subunit-like protein